MRKILFVFITLLCSCSSAVTESVSQKVTFSPVDIEDSVVEYNDLVDLCEIIPLENVKKGMLSDVQKVHVTDSSFYIFDDGGIPAVIKFDSRGKYVCNIGAVGHGKNEYDYIDDFAVSEQNGTVVILTEGEIVKVYDMSGKYLYSKVLKVLAGSTNVYFKKIISVSDGYVCLTDYYGLEDGYLLYFFDKNFELISRRLKQDPDKISRVCFIPNPMRANGNNVYYFDFYKQTINILPFDKSDECRTIQLYTDRMVGLDDFKEKKNPAELTKYDCVDAILCLEDKAYLNICINTYGYALKVDYNSDVVQAYMGAWLPELETYRKGYLYSVVPPDEFLQYFDEKPIAPSGLLESIRSKSQHFIDDFSEMSNFVIFKMKPNK